MDSGQVYLQGKMQLEGHELVDELREMQAEVTLDLCRRFVREYPVIIQQAFFQTGVESYYCRRRPEDSRLDPSKTIAEQFDLLRVVDNERYPAFFDWKGRRYIIRIEKQDN